MTDNITGADRLTDLDVIGGLAGEDEPSEGRADDAQRILNDQSAVVRSCSPEINHNNNNNNNNKGKSIRREVN